MTGRRRFLLLLAACVVLGAVAGSGTVAGDADDYCSELDDAPFVGVISEPSDENVTVYEGTTLEIVYCIDDGDDGSTASAGDWLEDGDGFEIEAGPEAGAYTVNVTGNVSGGSIDVSEHVDGDGDELNGVVVEVIRPGTPGLEGVERIGATDEYADLERAYLAAAADLGNQTTELNAVVEEREDGAKIDLEDGNASVRAIERNYGTMIEKETQLSEYLLDATKRGNSTGTIAALEAVDGHSKDRTNETEDVIAAYEDNVTADRETYRSTVRLSVGGPLAAGLVIGAIAGAAVPIAAARRVEEKMKLSRNVTYGRASALVPIVVGLLVAIVGLVVLYWIGNGATLLEVLR